LSASRHRRFCFVARHATDIKTSSIAGAVSLGRHALVHWRLALLRAAAAAALQVMDGDAPVRVSERLLRPRRRRLGSERGVASNGHRVGRRRAAELAARHRLPCGNAAYERPIGDKSDAVAHPVLVTANGSVSGRAVDTAAL